MTAEYDAAASAGEPAERRSLPCPTEACTGEVYPWLNPPKVEGQVDEETPATDEATYRFEPDLTAGDRWIRAAAKRHGDSFLLQVIADNADQFEAALRANLAAALAELAPKRDVFAERVRNPPHAERPGGFVTPLGYTAAIGHHARVIEALARRKSPSDPLRLSTEDWEALKRVLPAAGDPPAWQRNWLTSQLLGIRVVIEDRPTVAPETTPFPRGWLWRALDRLFGGSA